VCLVKESKLAQGIILSLVLGVGLGGASVLQVRKLLMLPTGSDVHSVAAGIVCAVRYGYYANRIGADYD
jgi:hypothetical protein